MTGARPKAARTRAPRRVKPDVVVRIAQTIVPKLPHERDESAERRSKPPQNVIVQAAEDLASGRQDTDRGPQTTRLARRLKSRN